MTRTEARIKNGSQVFRAAPQLTYLPAAEIITVVVVVDFLKSSDIALTCVTPSEFPVLKD